MGCRTVLCPWSSIRRYDIEQTESVTDTKI